MTPIIQNLKAVFRRCFEKWRLQKIHKMPKKTAVLEFFFNYDVHLLHFFLWSICGQLLLCIEIEVIPPNPSAKSWTGNLLTVSVHLIKAAFS